MLDQQVVERVVDVRGELERIVVRDFERRAAHAQLVLHALARAQDFHQPADCSAQHGAEDLRRLARRVEPFDAGGCDQRSQLRIIICRKVARRAAEAACAPPVPAPKAERDATRATVRCGRRTRRRLGLDALRQRRLRARLHFAHAEPLRAGRMIFVARCAALLHETRGAILFGYRRPRRGNFARRAARLVVARLQQRERIVVVLGLRILRERNPDLVGVDEQHVAVAQLMRVAAGQAMVRRVDEDAVGAGVLDEVLAVQIADEGVPAGYVRIREHPVVVRQAADGAAHGVEDLAAARAEVLRLLANDFQREDHGDWPAPAALYPPEMIMETLGASQYRAGDRKNNEYYRPLPTDFRPLTGDRDQ